MCALRGLPQDSPLHPHRVYSTQMPFRVCAEAMCIPGQHTIYLHKLGHLRFNEWMNAIFKEQRDTLQAARLGLLLLLYVILSRRRRTTSGMTEQWILAGCDKFKVFTCRPRPSHSRQGDPVAFPSAPADIGSGRRKRSTGHGGCALIGVRTRNTGLVLGLGHFFHTLFTLRMYI